jgi:hypothetical protein
MNFLAIVITVMLAGIAVWIVPPDPTLPVWQMALLCICIGVLVQRVWYWLTWPDKD